jgi:hypothetical protein
METAPRDGLRILIDAEPGSDVAHNAINDYVFARWDPAAQVWERSPDVPGTRIDTAHGWLPRSVLPPSTGS